MVDWDELIKSAKDGTIPLNIDLLDNIMTEATEKISKLEEKRNTFEGLWNWERKNFKRFARKQIKSEMFDLKYIDELEQKIKEQADRIKNLEQDVRDMIYGINEIINDWGGEIDDKLTGQLENLLSEFLPKSPQATGKEWPVKVKRTVEDILSQLDPMDAQLLRNCLNTELLEESSDAGKRKKCPDGGTCHHECKDKCWRVSYCGPLSGVFPNDDWPSDIKIEHKDGLYDTRDGG